LWERSPHPPTLNIYVLTPDLSIAILMLDVEGKEQQIIAGARRLLESGIVKNILTEFRRLGRKSMQAAIKILLDTGYNSSAYE
jgi:hypothetical protein